MLRPIGRTKGIGRLFVIMMLSFSMIAASLCSVTSEADAAETLQWPVPGHTGLSRGYSSGHPALDICDGSISGANVYAACGGTVTTIYKCGSQHFGSNHDCNGFGTGLAIQGTDGKTYQYAHMKADSIPANVYYGATVSKGQLIGQVGTTGNSSGAHLHFGVSNGSKYWENLVDPSSFSYSYETPNAHTHKYTASVTKQPTYTATGTRTYKCSCGNSYTEAIPKLEKPVEEEKPVVKEEPAKEKFKIVIREGNKIKKNIRWKSVSKNVKHFYGKWSKVKKYFP